MTLVKATALILMAAVFNPLCCCLELFAGELAPEPQPAESHSCCSATHANQPSDDAERSHANDDCPHAFEKESQISQSADHWESSVKANQHLLALLPAFEILTRAPEMQIRLQLVDRAELRPATLPITQTCCVYLL